ncbi:transposase [Chryseotalea sanaruensis]|uniref:Transposase n=1 Tax=Chryseotalea sanaruensis TaxID=2482724 RepID=A0A401UF41_9BACT|nr:transposase [Chryseotalea sanaruensis]GCC53492.1 transposase [Chryseotalea sanaruensis]
MGYAYRIYDQFGQYFITCTVNQWVDVFTRRTYIDILLASIRHCQQHKGLKVYAWVVMTNHIHMIISSDKEKLSDIIRDFKKFTSSRIVAAIKENMKESRKSWLLWLLKKEDKVIFWQEGYHGEEIRTQSFFDTKITYIHMNPVRAGIVEKEEEYMYSSCGDYYGTRKGLLELADS